MDRSTPVAHSTFVARSAAFFDEKPRTPASDPSPRTTASASTRCARVSRGEAPTGIVRTAGKAVTTSVPASASFSSSSRCTAVAMRSLAAMGTGFGRTRTGRTST
jgi:hypothetical protein